MFLDTFFSSSRIEAFQSAFLLHPEWRKAFQLLVRDMLACTTVLLAAAKPLRGYGTYVFFLSNANHQLVAGGILSLFKQDEYSCGLLRSFVVSPDFRHRGYGREMLQQLLRSLPEELACVEVRLSPESILAQTFFEHCGFRNMTCDDNVITYRLLLLNSRGTKHAL